MNMDFEQKRLQNKCETEKYIRVIIQEVGNWYGDYSESDSKIHIDNGDKVYVYNTPLEAAQDWVYNSFLLQIKEVLEMKEVILIERNYKGEYERYALTYEEFNKEFGSCLIEGMPYPNEDGSTYTLRPLVHMWYQSSEVGSKEWNQFFTDMTLGMAEGDIAEGNLACVREDLMLSLKDYLPQYQGSLPEKAYTILDDILNKPNGGQLFFIANILYMLQQDETPLNREEQMFMAQRILDVSNYSSIPLLTAERVDAVCTLLNNGMTKNRSPEFPAATPEQMKEVLLSCDIDVFAEIIEAVAVDNQEFYGPDNEYSQDAIMMHQKAVDVIQSVARKKPPLSEQITFIRTNNSTDKNLPSIGKEPEQEL